MLPLRDGIPTDRFPLVTVLLIAINVAVFAWQLGQPTDAATSRAGAEAGLSARDQASFEYGAIPARITEPGSECALADARGGEVDIECGAPAQVRAQGVVPLDAVPWWATLLTSMFMHGGWLHIIGNMLFLWVFGNNVEDSMGRARFVAFYLLSGLVAVYAQAAIDPESTIPTIGASGAVAGVLGGYLLLHPRARVLTLVFIIFFVTVIEVPALILLAVWFALQFLPALDQLTAPSGEAGVAYLAHVGGFVFGLLTISLFSRKRRDRWRPMPYD
jgi:membrane associated rhomboid family serine protease